MREIRIGKTREEARSAAMEALKERLWKECWKDEIELPVKEERVSMEGGMFKVELTV